MLSTPESSPFADEYRCARSKFLRACDASGLTVDSVPHPLSGPRGEELFVDVAGMGPVQAENLVIVVSGTHGLEGLAGSGCQIGWIVERGSASIPSGVGVLMIHMLNPWGAAWGRRQTHENVDLNRNFIDFTQARPANEHYRALRLPLACPQHEGPIRDQANADIAEYCRLHGQHSLASAIFQGQYEDPSGVGFGGTGPTWSHRTLHRLLRSHASNAHRVAVIDLHTGFGPYGYGTPISASAPGSLSAEAARHWYGPSLMQLHEGGAALPYRIVGDLCNAIEQLLDRAAVVPIALEFGTFGVPELIETQVLDGWLHRHGSIDSEQGRILRQRFQHFFYPATRDWLDMVHFRFLQIMDLAIRGVMSLPPYPA